MFKKILSSMGIGSAKIDLVLDQQEVRMGDELHGRLVITGGQVDQNIGKIRIELRVSSYYSRDDSEGTIKVNQEVGWMEFDPFVLKAGDRIEEPITFHIPHQLPISSFRTKYYFKTNLDIQQGLDSNDKDEIVILPSGILKNFFDAMEQLGMVPKGEIFMGFEQVIGFKPTTWLADQLDELKFQYEALDTEQGLRGLFEVDKKAKGWKGLIADGLDLDEKTGRFLFTPEQLDTVEKAKETIQQFVQKQLQSIK